ncbi:MAG: calcium/sodium antiporter [Candidatus ainarchaeum sp.]|nr:calcium/sodium antiporter [Candidatus ainarchaeum sp.]MDD3975583.1 calcium/sodium antiporter [Candidatus ainarchaeum sp.]
MFSLAVWIIVFLASLFLLIKSSDYFIDSAEKIGVYFGLPAFVIGIIIVSIGTSLPELISSIFSVLKGASEIGVGTVIGSNITNIFFVLGLTAVVYRKTIKINYNILSSDLPFLVATSFIVGIMLFNQTFTVLETIICLVLLVFYIYNIISSSRTSKDKELRKEFSDIENSKKKLNILKTLFILILSCAGIYFGAKYVVDSILNISSILKIATDIIAISAVALGTSLPELVVTLQAIRKNKPEIAIGNVLGSNIFNLVGVIGITSLFGKIVVPSSLLTFGIPMLIVSTLIYFFVIQDNKLTYIEGFALLIFYIYFLGHIFGIV